MASQRPQPRRGASSNNSVLPHEDVLYEILLRVPARSLCRFRAVCQSWLSLLTDPPFVAAHAARHSGNPLFAVAVAVAGGGTNGKVAEIRLLDTFGRVVKTVSAGPASSLRHMRPHLDLVLLRGNVGFERNALRLLDPSNGVVSSLPMQCRLVTTLGGNDFFRTFVLGRAVSSSTGGQGQYKVLSLDSSADATQPWKILTVSGGSGTWRAAPAPPVRIKSFGNGTVVANGVVYNLVDNANTWSIAAFDLEVEQWRPSLVQGPVPTPSIDGAHAQLYSLAELNGRLAAVSTTVSPIMDIWLLMGSSSKWYKQCRVRTGCIYQHIWPSSVMEAKPLWVLDDGRIALWVPSGDIIRTGSGALWMYEPRTGKCTKLAVTKNCLNVGVGVYTGNLLL